MSGHGHVTPNPDGSKARCGGPAICAHCAREAAQLASGDRVPVAARTALLSLAAEIDAMAGRPRLPGTDSGAYLYSRGIIRGIAELARRRADEGPGEPLDADPVSREGQEPAGDPAAPARVALGMLVRAVWVSWAREQPDARPSWLAGWDDLDAGQREVDMRIGEAVAAAERERLAQLAEDRSATYEPECSCGVSHGDGKSFADLIRKEPGDG